MACIFCRIVAGDASSRTVLETETVQAFLDANPLAAGHTLVIPTAHYERIADMPADVARDVFATVHQLVPVVETAVEADATTVAFNDGRAAGQEVPHTHGHIVPRFDDDGARPIHYLFRSRPDVPAAELDRIATEIASGVDAS